MKLSELRAIVRKVVREEIESIVEERLDEVVMKKIGEVYIRGLVEQVATGRTVVREDASPPATKRSTPENTRRMAAAVSRQAQQRMPEAPPTRASSSPLLSPNNPLADLYEGVTPLDEAEDDEGLPLEALDISRIRAINSRLNG